MPRPEHNLIQAPELVRRLFRRLGVRQSHIAPTLNEGVQAVVVLEDLTDPLTQESSGATQHYSATSGFTPDTLFVAAFGLSLFGAQDTAAIIRRVVFDNQKIGASVGYYAVYGLEPPPGSVISSFAEQFSSFGHGWNQRLETKGISRYKLSSFQDTIVNVPNVPRPLGKVACDVFSTVFLEFPADRAPIVMPGGWFYVKQGTTNADIDVTIEWDEVPLSPKV